MVPILLLSLLLLFAVYVFNSLVSLRARAKGAWADIDVQLKKRHELVPNLVQVVKGYSDFERDTLERVVSLRAQAQGAATPAQASGSEEALGRDLSRLVMLAENYPELKANAQYLALQRQLVQVEDDLQSARRYYNAVVRDFNTLRQSFPQNLLAGALGFGPLEFFGAEAGDREGVRVQL